MLGDWLVVLVPQAGAGSALLFVSLVGGFGAPRINKVLSSTGYLTSPSKHTYRRLVETIQMVSGTTATNERLCECVDLWVLG